MEKMTGWAVIPAAHVRHVCTMRTDHLDRSLPAHCRGTLRGMDAA